MSGQTGVLFNVDGTLVGATYLHFTSRWQAFRQFDLDEARAFSVYRAPAALLASLDQSALAWP